MAGKLTKTQRTYKIEGESGVAMYTGVTYGSQEGYVAVPEADNAVLVGVVCNDERIDDPLRAGGSQAGRNVAVQVDGYPAIKLGGTVNYGERLILGAGGVAIAMPDGTGNEEVTKIKVLTPCTTAGNVVVNIDGTNKNVAVTTDDNTAAKVATAIATVLNALEGYTAAATTDTVTVTAGAKGNKADITVSGGDTGVTAQVTITQGAADNSGVYNVIGFAEKGGTIGDVIPFKLVLQSYDVE